MWAAPRQVQRASQCGLRSSLAWVARSSGRALATSETPISWPRPGRVGMIGVGQLGSAVVGNLIRAGLQPVLHDAKGEELVRPLLAQGASWAPSPRALAERCDVIMTGLPRPEHVSAAMGLGEDGAAASADGVLAGLQPGSVWIEHSTTDFNNTVRIREEVEKRGGKAVAAPLTGGMQILKVGKMVALVGAEEETFEQVKHLISLSAPRIVRCGEFGHETVVKILSNMLCAVQDCAMGEAMMIAKKSGVDMKLLFDAIRISSGNSFCWETEFARAFDGTYFPDFTAEMMAKDIELGQGLARKHGVPMLMHGQVAQIYEMCMAKYGRDSGSTIPVRLVEDSCGERLCDEKSRKVFKDWTYTTEIVDGSYTIVHQNYDNPYSKIGHTLPKK
uniref:3-hydroxyisobutyrate dehydrogenase n=1 Tax=Alexandrium catenella TaxID=2925 RepID=A0A7S1WDH5_ALECA|eukprot:CAMPEP_0171169838 /NCGR_PEP_ID=MMETSP0790-20130122/8413_1 /TAXON_ID=2925 /ORGANISM="Alexandrium catenella, Strain OF101" /LENGTH=388 /DNA_ID=CAMNT_0011634683 /DNA_START=80 /DNA_END=1246 /DNA_ORIENTATION=+